MNVLKQIIEWFKSNCDGDWEHSYGVMISTLDNPGWSVEIYLYGTELEDKVFDEISINNNENDWMFCTVKDYFFKGMGDPDKLEAILKAFAIWQMKYDPIE